MKKSKKQLYHKTSKNNIIINPDWNTLMYNDVAYTNAKLTTAKTEINRKGNYSSELCFINVNNHLKNAIFTVATAALQEVDRQLQHDEVENDSISSRLTKLEEMF